MAHFLYWVVSPHNYYLCQPGFLLELSFAEYIAPHRCSYLGWRSSFHQKISEFLLLMPKFPDADHHKTPKYPQKQNTLSPSGSWFRMFYHIRGFRARNLLLLSPENPLLHHHFHLGNKFRMPLYLQLLFEPTQAILKRSSCNNGVTES